ncbi:MAG: WecB/TagA/CpsF family glycosyltransferase [Tropicimonas sp.]|uniref:WecB/TagA/CpsF family glycosyltransferase n=1 Tax=Tropicimonas sp. TaxID=2067044 RepID=UPI003A836987
MAPHDSTLQPSPTLRVPLGKGAHFDVRLTNPTAGDLLAEIERHLLAGQGFAIATINLDHVVKLRHSEAFRHAYGSHSHVVADGNPIVWMSRLSGRPVTLVPGSELVEPVAAMAARTGMPIGFFGASDDSLALAAAALEARHPGLRIATRIAPRHGFNPAGAEADACIAEMATSPARLWLLALGAPKQEIFAARAREKLPDRGFLSIGAGIDFIAGHQVRAPKFVQALALEWAWRMFGSPLRLVPRYARCAAAMPGLAGAALQQRFVRGQP